MNVGLDLAAALAIVLFFWGWQKLLHGMPASKGCAVMLRWSGGVGRAKLLDRAGGVWRVSAPLTRRAYPSPARGSELLVKPAGGDARRARLLEDAGDSWRIRLA